jgi:hypothetical protein
MESSPSLCHLRVQNNLADFGYILDMKAGGRKKKFFYILGYLLELIINLQNLVNVGHFFHEKSFL